jgi:Ca-activated chloride channel family protein
MRSWFRCVKDNAPYLGCRLPGPDIWLTKFYATMTPSGPHSCMLCSMRGIVLFLFGSWLAFNPAHAQPVPTLSIATDREYYHAGARDKIYLEVHVGTSPTALKTQPEASRNIAFVLDRSGSMAGKPIQSVRGALSTALSSLSEHDLVSIVLFGSEVETLLEAKPRGQIDNLDSLLAKIEPAGGAALYDALNQGAAQLRRHAAPSTINHLILITDGHPTRGPRELSDFSKLAEVFTREGITLSTIGIGQDFNEDLLAALARTGNGTFRYAAQPDKLPDVLQAELAPRRALLARDATLTIEYTSECEDVSSYGWKQAVVEGKTVTYHFPHLFADQDLNVLTSAIVSGRKYSYTLGSVRLRWNDLASGTPFELKKPVSALFETDEVAVRKSANAAVIRTSASTLISEGMQRAIEQIDKGDFRRALRALRWARDDAESLNDDLDDPQVKTKIKQLETYLAEVQARGLNQLDRKILRSGLFNQFETPTAEEQKGK